MRKIIHIKYYFFCCIFLIISSIVNAQEDEYVINKPEKKRASNILFSRMKNPDITNYFLTATAYTLRKRDIRVSGTDIIFVKGSYGLTNDLTASINASFIGMMVGTIKYKVELNDDLNLGFSGSFGSLASNTNDSTIFLGGAQSMITYGDIQDNITFGLGYYHVKSDYDITQDNDELSVYKVYMGLQKQISNRVFILADAIYFPEYNVITGGGGVKIIIKDYMSLLVGIMPITQEYLYLNNRKIRQSLVLPIVSFRVFLDRH